MKRYMLDTNTVSHLLKEHPPVMRRLASVPMASLCISAVTAGELHLGLAKRPDAARLHLAIGEFLRRVDAIPWDGVVAKRYGSVRADLIRAGKALGPLDLLIATHALCVDAVLVTNDRVFGQVADLQIEDWTRAVES